MGSVGTVKNGATVYLDTNPIIYLTEGNAAFKVSITGLFTEFDRAGARLVTSELALTEALVLPLRNKDGELVAVYERLFGTLIEALPISREVLVLAASLRAETPGLKTPDAIHLATAILANADVFLSGDHGIKNLPGSMQKLSV